MWAMPSRRRTTFPTLSSPASNRRPCASLSCLTGIIAGLPLGRQLGSTSPQNPNVGNYRFFPGFVLVGIPIQGLVQSVGRQFVGKVLRAIPVSDPGEGVVGHAVADALGSQLASQPVVPVAVELQPERTPGRHTQVDQSKRGIQEVEVVVQAFAAVGPHEGL